MKPNLEHFIIPVNFGGLWYLFSIVNGHEPTTEYVIKFLLAMFSILGFNAFLFYQIIKKLRENSDGQ